MPDKRDPPSFESEEMVDHNIQALIEKADELVDQLRHLVTQMKRKVEVEEENGES